MKTGKGDRKGGARLGPDQPWHPGDGAEGGSTGRGTSRPRSPCVPSSVLRQQGRVRPACPCVSITHAALGLRGVALALGGSFSEPLARGRPQRRSGRPGAAARSQGSQVAPLRRVLGWGRREPGPPARAVTALPLAVPTGSAISCPELRKAWPGSPWRLRKRVPPGAASCSFSVGDSGSGRPASWDCALAWARGRASALTGACVK